MRSLLSANPVQAWTTAGLIAAAVCLALLLAKGAIGQRLVRLAKRTSTDVDDIAAELVTKVRWYFILALAVRAGTVALDVSSTVDRSLRQVAAIAVLLQLAVWGVALINFWVRRLTARRGAVAGSTTLSALSFGAKGVLWALLVVLAIRNVLDYDVAALLTGLGIGGIAIALAVQNILGDVFAALSIFLDRPFEVGDPIAVDAIAGTVEHIGLKTTRVRSVNGEEVIFSNTDLLKSRVRNLKTLTERRAVLHLYLAPDSPSDLVAQVQPTIHSSVIQQPNARFERAHLSRFAEAGLEFEAVYFVNGDHQAFIDCQHAVNMAVFGKCRELGLRLSSAGRDRLAS